MCTFDKQYRLDVWIRSGEGKQCRISKLAVHEAQSLVSVLSTVTIVGRGVVAIAAVRIRSITVRLDLAVVRAASLAGWTGRELDNRSVSHHDLEHIVRQISNILHQLCKCQRCTVLQLQSVGRP